MQLDDSSRGMPGQLMQTVDVLGDQGIETPLPVQTGQRTMGRVGLGVPEPLPALQLVLPVPDRAS